MAEERTLRAPVQARAHQTRAALLAAAEREFSERGYAQTTAKSIAERAQVATGSVYQYFRDKDALLHELASARMQELTERVRAVGRLADGTAAARRSTAGDAESLEEQARLAVRRVIDAVLEYHRKDVGLHAVLTERRHADPELDAIHRATERSFIEHNAASLTHWGYAGDRKALAFVIFGLIEGAVHSHVLGMRVLSDRRFIDALAEAVLTLVRAGLPGAQGGRGGTGHADAE
jgi:AcrR family transcriptional regulator